MKKYQARDASGSKRTGKASQDEADRFVRFVDIVRSMEQDATLTILEAKFRQYPSGALERFIRPTYLALREAELAAPPGHTGYAGPVLASQLELAAHYVSEAVFVGVAAACIQTLSCDESCTSQRLQEFRLAGHGREWPVDLLAREWSEVEHQCSQSDLRRLMSGRVGHSPRLRQIAEGLAPEFGIRVEEMSSAKCFSDASLVRILFDGPSTDRIFSAAIQQLISFPVTQPPHAGSP